MRYGILAAFAEAGIRIASPTYEIVGLPHIKLQSEAQAVKR